MNYIIGMCKESKQWIPILNKWGYEVQIIEQTMHTEKGDGYVKPDIVAASNILLHALVFEMKGGTSIKKEQLERYTNLEPSDLRWVTVYDKAHLRMDVCLCDFEENHFAIKQVNTVFPTLIFNDTILQKEGNFRIEKLNELFKEPISLEGKTQPYSYYPFSEEDDQAYIAIHVIRTIVSILQKNNKMAMIDNLEELQNSFVALDDILATKFNYIWKVLSEEQKKALKAKIGDVTRRVFAEKALMESLGVIQSKEGYKVTRNLEQFERLSIKFIEQLMSEKGQANLPNFPSTFPYKTP